MRKILLFLLSLITVGAWGQGVQNGSGTLTATGGALSTCYPTQSVAGTCVFVPNNNGAYGMTFDEVPSGSPTGVNILIYGCMRGGKCSSVLDTNTSTTEAIRPVLATTPYDVFVIVSATLTGGTSPSFTINYKLSTADAHTSTTYTGSAPIVVSGTAISCPTCGTSSGTVQNVATAGIATGGPITTTGTVTVTGSGNTTTATTAAANVAGAATGNVITSDGAGNVQSGGTLLSALALSSSLTPSGVGLGNVTNDVQTKAAIVPNAAPAAGAILLGNAGGTAYASITTTGCTITSAGAVTCSPTAVGLSSVTNDAQTKAAIVPNTAPSAGQVAVGNAGGTAYAPVSITGCTLTSAGALTCPAPALSAVTALAGNTTLANGNNTWTLNSAQTSNTQSAVSFGETSAATGGSANNEVAISTAANSTSTVLSVTQGAISTVFPTAAVNITQGANTGATNVPALNIATTLNNASLTGGVMTFAVSNTSSAGTQSFINFLGGAAAGTTEAIIDLAGNFRAAGNFESTATTGNSVFTGGVATSSNNGLVGGALFQGSHNSNTNSGVKAGYAIFTGGINSAATPNAAALEGVVEIQAGYLKGTAIANVGDVVCGTTTAFTVTDCPITPGLNIVGIADTTANPIGVISYGTALVKFDGTVTLGDIACMGTTTAGLAHDNGSTTTGCVLGSAIGVIVADSGTITIASATTTAAVAMSTTLALVQLHISQ